MAEKIKGITIEFRGNATPLQKAIREVNSDLKSTTKELSEVNKALKFNPTNVDLWRQKQDLLKQKIGETETKLDALKQAQKQMDASGVDKNSQEYRKLQREIIETESQLKTFNGQLKEIGNVNLKVLSEQFKQAGAKATELGTTLSKNVTAPIVALGAGSIKAFNEVKEGLNIVAQKTGATGDELKEMQGITRDLAKTIPTDFEAAGTAVGELNTRFGVTGKELETLSQQYIKFAKVNDVDLNNSIDQTQKALSAFGESASKAPALLDTLTKAGQMTGASVDSLTEGLIQNGTAFQELGLNIDQSVMLMAQMEKSGANSETVMQGLRKALKNAAAEGKPLDQALSELQQTILNGKGGMDGLTAAYDLFGKSGDQIYGAVKNGTLDFQALGAAVADTGGTLDAVFEETLTPAERFQTTMNSVKDAGYELGNTIMTMLEPYMTKLADAAQRVSEWWETLDDDQKQLITTLLLVAASIGPLLILIGKMATGISAIISVVNMAGAAISMLGGGPLVAIVAAIAAVIAIGVLLYKNWDKIKETASKVGADIKGTWESVKTAVSNAMDRLKESVLGAWDKIKTGISRAGQSIWHALTWPFEKAWAAIQKAVDWIRGLFPIDLGNLFSGIKLPHFNIEWGQIQFGDWTIDYPSGFDIDWYKKGGIFNSASLIGVGEAGAEAVVPLDKFWDKLDNIAAASGAPTINIYPTPYQSAREIAAEVEKILSNKQIRRNMAYGNI